MATKEPYGYIALRRRFPVNSENVVVTPVHHAPPGHIQRTVPSSGTRKGKESCLEINRLLICQTPVRLGQCDFSQRLQFKFGVTMCHSLHLLLCRFTGLRIRNWARKSVEGKSRDIPVDFLKPYMLMYITLTDSSFFKYASISGKFVRLFPSSKGNGQTFGSATASSKNPIVIIAFSLYLSRCFLISITLFMAFFQ